MKEPTIGPVFLTVVDNYWVLKSNTSQYRLNAISVPLDAIMQAIGDLYPTLSVEIDMSISNNIWFGKHLVRAAIQGSYDLKSLAGEFQYQEARICSRCKGETFYNGDYNRWVCPEDHTYESFIDHWRYFRRVRNGNQKLRRGKTQKGRDEAARRREYFGNR